MNKNIFKIIGLSFLLIGLSLVIDGKYTQASFTPVQGITYTVSLTAIPTASTITLSSFNNSNGTPYVMSNFGYKGYGTVDPTNTARLESVSFTGITKNASSVTLTGVTRGLDFVYPYTASSTLQRTHLVGAGFILSNTSAFYGNEFLFKNNIGTSTALLIFSSTTPPRLDFNPVFSLFSTTTLATVGYVNDTTTAGAPVASEAVTGIVRLATQLQMASSTFSAGTPTVLYTAYATSSPGTGCGLCTPITRNDGKLSPLFIATTTADNYNFNGTLTSSGTTTLSGQNNTIASSTQYTINVGQINATSTPKVNGVTLVTNTTVPHYSVIGQANVTASSGWATSTMLTLPSGTLTASSTISIRGSILCDTSSGSERIHIVNGSGTPFVTDIFNINCGSGPQVVVTFTADIYPNNSLVSQMTNFYGTAIQVGGTIASAGQPDQYAESTSAFDFSQSTSLGISINSPTNAITLRGYSIIVNP